MSDSFAPHDGYTGPPMTRAIADRAIEYYRAGTALRRTLAAQWIPAADMPAYLEKLEVCQKIQAERDAVRLREETAKATAKSNLAPQRYRARRLLELHDLGFNAHEAEGIVADELDRKLALANLTATLKELGHYCGVSGGRIGQRVQKGKRRMARAQSPFEWRIDSLPDEAVRYPKKVLSSMSRAAEQVVTDAFWDFVSV